jgi:hypothetical protein
MRSQIFRAMMLALLALAATPLASAQPVLLQDKPFVGQILFLAENGYTVVRP